MGSLEEAVWSSVLDFGFTIDVMPIAAVPERTTYIEAGPITIGVEYRYLTDEIVEHAVGDDDEAMALADRLLPKHQDDEGVSIHVFATADGAEYLRFDCFRHEPHYHYIRPKLNNNTTVEIDPHATGDILAFVLGCLRDRLPAMLTYADAPDLAAHVEANAVEAVLPQVEAAAVAAQRAATPR